MNKKVDKKTLIVGIGFLLVMIIGCVLLVKDSIPKKSTERLITPIPLQIEGWESQKVETLCLDVNQSYPEEWFGFFKETLVKLGMNLNPRQYSFPYEELTSEILQNIGITVVGLDTPCDSILSINVTGTATSRTYGDIITRLGKQQCYTGTSVNGVFTLKSENHETFQTPIYGHVSSPETTHDCPEQPYDAPFDESSAAALTDGLVQLWGQEIAKIIQGLYFTGNSYEEAMYDAARSIIKNEVTPHPTMPEAEPPTNITP